MELFWTLEAIQDRDDIYDCIETDNPTTTLAFDELLEEKATLLVRYPALRQIGRVPDTREFVVHRNYIFIYGVVDDLVRVLNLVHIARQWPSMS
ncbi:type II toxin-antitoxin system RelE/ParE family toxin [Xylella taiwanensis]|uniref:Translation repressor RelE n=1 Tax=Xylella taiwanensis TaxID=1444770 RepID=Z9JLF2_9GAMM|nr:type II toxin-antitoxin system RelE/ParE family toxin [Xylella taiwanensis]AXI84083.1 translation repressor RelE [Xylella taiwanensis]EWS78999.1 translation repressor RelE [Xylella taiwanensis]MCD8457200.1 type II toxin-antitoxin system RelE/ParE family toxin [Xylella taiwanensis]MCD8459609.1 type II toxin-antitoxin system RelE/ParE family toxin [Xylella taiwanensis]MCD8461524.1 type II toxin-antitoxin system RelE/ParE family toxin [Xylella taiwanensis]